MTEQELKRAWKQQPTSTLSLSSAELEAGARRLRRGVRVRNAIEYLASLLVVVICIGYAIEFDGPLMRSGAILAALGSVVVMFGRHRHASSRALPPASTGLAWKDYQRAELVRQRDALRSAWRWYVLPLVPGLVVFRLGVETEFAHSAAFAHGWIVNGVLAAFMLAVVALNAWSARRVQRRIDALEAY